VRGIDACCSHRGQNIGYKYTLHLRPTVRIWYWKTGNRVINYWIIVGVLILDVYTDIKNCNVAGLKIKILSTVLN
jgi:hypothetical protein